MDYQKVIRYRAAWMGVAMMWIVWFHVPLTPAMEFVRFVKQIGYGGVDLCLFASGVGCYYSLQKDPDAGRFMGRRLRRLAPVYLSFMAIWIPWQISMGAATIPNMIGNFFGIQYLTALGGDFNWYVSAILVFYVLAPYLKAFIDSTGRCGRWLLLGVLLILVIPFWMSGEYIIIVTRLPVFYLGMLFAAGSREGKVIRPWQWVAGFVLMGFGMYVLKLGYRHIPDKMWAYGVYWCPFVLIAPYLCVLISGLMALMERIPWGRTVVRALCVAGEYSFEIYLLHIPMVELLKAWMEEQGIRSGEVLIWLAGICVMALCCRLLRKAAALAARLFKQAE